MTDLMNIFYELDVERTGVVCLADFERLMLQLSFGPDAALRLFQRLDTDGDGALSLSDWTSENSKSLAEMLCFRIIRQRLVGRNPVKAQMPTPSVSSFRHRVHFPMPCQRGPILCQKAVDVCPCLPALHLFAH
jgi:hypothetical protein